MDTFEICKALIQDGFKSPDQWKSNLAQAEALLSTEVSESPESTLALTCLGAALCDQGKHQQAAEVLHRAVELGSTDRNTFFNLGVAILNYGVHEEAMGYFSKARALTASPRSWEAYFDPQAH